MPDFKDPITINGDKVSKAETNAASTKATPAAGDLWGYLDTVTPFLWVKMTTTQKITWLTTLFADLTTNQSIGGLKTFIANVAIATLSTTGAALSVVRNLTATSTDSPVVSILQDHASDDQPALKVEQDGTGDILDLLSGATEVLSVDHAGMVDSGGYGTLATLLGNARVAIADNIDSPSGAQMYNSNTGTSADFRFAVFDTLKDAYVAFAMPGNNNSATLFGVLRNSAAFIFTNGGSRLRNLVIGTINAKDLIFGTTNFERMRITSTGLFGFGVTAPKGLLHGFDGTGSFIHVSKTIINTTAQVIAPAGSVNTMLTGMGVVSDGISSFAAMPGGAVLTPGGAVSTIVCGSSTYVLRVNADGSIDVRRTVGTGGGTATFWLVWQ